MKSITRFLSSLFSFLPNWLFGIRVVGEKLPEPTFRTIETDRPDFTEWCQFVGASKEWRDPEPLFRARWLMNQWKVYSGGQDIARRLSRR